MSLDQIFHESNGAELWAYTKKIASAYSVRLAFYLLDALRQPYTRIVEDVRVAHGECRRTMTIDWTLPTLAEALPHAAGVSDPRFLKAFAEYQTDIPVPLVPIPVRKSEQVKDLVAMASDGRQLYVCGHAEGMDRDQRVLESFWGFIEQRADVSPNCDRTRLDIAREAFYTLPAQPRAEVYKVVQFVQNTLERSGVVVGDMLNKRISLLGRYMAQHHIAWLRVPGQPGDSVRLTLSYSTRFSTDYSPRRGGPSGLGDYRFIRRRLDSVRRVVGQEPYRVSIPVWLSTYCRSYHFTMAAPPTMYFATQRFALERNLHQSDAEQRAAFASYYKKNGAEVSGSTDAGGPVARLYARDLPMTAENQVYAHARLRERPPGSTALVMWLTLLTAGFLWFYWRIWQWLVANDTKGIDIATLSVTLLGTAAIWFSQTFRDEVRPRVPLLSRLGLTMVSLSTIYALVTIFLHRVACPRGTPTGNDLPTCPPTVLTRTFNAPGLLALAVAVSLVGLLLAKRWVNSHREYYRLQHEASS